MRKIRILGIFLALSLVGCDFADHRSFHDPALKLQREDYEKITAPPCFEKTRPQFCPKLAPLKSPLLTPEMRKKVSLSLNETLSLQSVFLELGRQAGVG